MDPGTIAIIGLCVFLVLWYVGGTIYNRRYGKHLFHWVEAGLQALGGEHQSGWIGSPASGARINVIHARKPFRRLEITLLMARREIPLLWLLDHLRGKRDGLIIRATLRSPGEGALEARPRRPAILGALMKPFPRRGGSPWTLERGPHDLIVAYQGTGGHQQAVRLKPWLDTYGRSLRRFSWAKHDPHLQLHVNVGALTDSPSETFMTDLQTAVGRTAH